MTATFLIKQIKALSAREQAKVRRFIYGQHLPNATTRMVVRAADSGKGLVRCKDSADLFSKLKV